MNPAQKRGIRNLAGYAFALACLVWVFHDIRFEDLRAGVRGMRWEWVPLAVAFDTGNYLFQGWRWKLLLRPIGRLSVWTVTRIVYAGLFLNEMLPMRLGEALRVWLVSRRLSTRFAAVIPSVVVERFLDGIWLALAVAAVAAFVPLPHDLVRAGDVLGILVALGALGFVGLVAGSGRAAGGTHPRGKTGRLSGFLAHQISGIRAIGLSGRLLLAATVTLFMLALQGTAFWLVLLACRIPLSLWAGLAVFLIVHFGTAIPNAPGNIGAYQFFCVLGLALFGVDKARAATFSLVVFFLLTVPLWGIGYFALTRSGLTLSAARGVLQRLRAREPEVP